MPFAVCIGEHRFRVSGVRALLGIAGLSLVGLAIRDQLRRPAPERTWHGQLWGTIPYDLRWPDPQKLLRSFWDPGNADIIKGKAFGVGWDVNFGAFARDPMGTGESPAA